MTRVQEAAVGPSIAGLRSDIERALGELLDAELRGLDPRVAAPLRHAVLSPGKRIRPLLLVAAYRVSGGRHQDVGTLACSVELVHAYSLVHDDLPCMDNDVLRRGRPTLHVTFGRSAAVIAGAALMPLAVSAILKACASMGLSPAITRELIKTLTAASGASGMVGGQLLDLRAEGRAVSAMELEAIHSGKTAKLIAASLVMGGIAANAPAEKLDRLGRFGLKLGLAFQAVDDILDMKGTARELGKTSGRDMELGKATYPAVMGLAEAERTSRELALQARDELEQLVGGHELEAIADYVIERRR